MPVAFAVANPHLCTGPVGDQSHFVRKASAACQVGGRQPEKKREFFCVFGFWYLQLKAIILFHAVVHCRNWVPLLIGFVEACYLGRQGTALASYKPSV